MRRCLGAILVVVLDPCLLRDRPAVFLSLVSCGSLTTGPPYKQGSLEGSHELALRGSLFLRGHVSPTMMILSDPRVSMMHAMVLLAMEFLLTHLCCRC